MSEFQLQRPDDGEPEDDLLSTGEVGRIFGVSSNTVLTWIKEGKIAAERNPGGGHYRIRRSVVMQHARSEFQGNDAEGVRDFI